MVRLRPALRVIRIEVEQLEGAWKLSQNKGTATQRSIARARALAALMGTGDGLARRSWGQVRKVFGRMVRCGLAWMDRRRGRAALAALDPRGRRDVGVRWEDVQREIGKPFWRG